MFRRTLPVLMMMLLAVPASVTAADNPLGAFPESTSVVVRVKNPTATVRQAVAFANQIDPQFGPTLQFMSAGMGAMISNPGMKGIEKGGDWWIGVFVTGPEQSSLVYAVPSSNPDELKEATINSENLTFVTHENWVFYTDDKDAAKSIEDRIGGKGKAITLDEASQKTFDSGDISVYVNGNQLRKTFSDELEQADDAIDGLLDELAQQIPPTAPNGPQIDMDAVMDLYADILHALLDAVNATEGFTLTINVDGKGMTFVDYVHFAEGSGVAKVLQNQPTSAFATLNQLPTKELVYVAASGDVEGLMDWSFDLVSNMFKENSEEVKALKDALAEFKKNKFGSYASSMSLGNLKEGAIRGVTLIEAENPKQLRDFILKSSQLSSGLNSGETEVKKDAETYGEYKADILIVKPTVNQELDPLGIQAEIMKAMYGPEGAVTRIVYLDDKIVQTVGGGKERMEAVLKSLDQESAPESPATATRAQLSEQANLVMLVDVGNLAGTALELFAESDLAAQLGVPLDPQTIKNLEIPESYLGVSVAAEKQGLRIRTYLPVQQVKGLVTLGQYFQRMAPNFNNPGAPQL